MPTPSIGRDVHYVSYGTPGGEFPSTCRAAKITVVDRLSEYSVVSLCVFNPTGLFFNEHIFEDATLPDGGPAMTPGTWHWPERVGDG